MKRAVLLGLAICLLAFPAAGAQATEVPEGMEGSAKLPMHVGYAPAWLTWVAATTGCLNALDIECDAVDVAGYSGYAFIMNVAEDLCVSGPTAFDWGMLSHGVALLGRSSVTFLGGTCGGTPDDFRAAYNLVRSEIEAGRPCVLWGTYVPEFGIAVGVEDGKYLVSTFKPFTGEPEPPIAFDKLEVPGGMYVLAFPAPADMPREEADRTAIYYAAEILSCQSGNPEYRRGLEAYDVWIAALTAGKADAFGNSYNAQCWAEAKRFAHEFLLRLAGRNESVAAPLGRAAEAYAEAAKHMGVVAELFPFPDTEGKVNDPEARSKVIEALRAARAAEARAMAAVLEAAAQWPRE
jgi:hypothetical protein